LRCGFQLWHHTNQSFVDDGFIAITGFTPKTKRDTFFISGFQGNNTLVDIAIECFTIELDIDLYDVLIWQAFFTDEVQRWYAIINPGKSPYGFYMISNLGSMLALISYPFVFEPRLRLVTQTLAWSVMYLVYIAMCLVCLVVVRRRTRRQPEIGNISGVGDDAQAGVPLPPVGMQVRWLGLSMLPCIMLLAATNEMTQNIAPIPLLWILPLALFLLSFIITFSPFSKPAYGVYVPVLLASSFLALLVMKDGPRFGIFPAIVVYSAALFSSCMICTTILYSLRPEPVHLTRYYLVIALGGALGGLFVGVVAPLLFNNYYEFRMGLVICCLAGAIIIWRQRDGWMRIARFPLIFLAVLIMFMLMFAAIYVSSHTIRQVRNFYGVVKVRALNGPHGWVRHSLVHGNIAHGIQILNSEFEFEPISYYAKEGGIGVAMQRYSLKPLRIGVIGLGAGMICSYAREGDYVKFYEINPEIVTIATNPAYFTYISHCEAEIDISLGDARISLERELKAGHRQNFDVLLIDAFSADSIPMHLVTKEAFKLYLEHLAPAGILVVNVSNTYIDLVPQIWTQRKYFALDGAIIRTKKDFKRGTDASTWVLLSRDNSIFLMPSVAGRSLNPSRIPDQKLWTDDYGSLLPAVRRIPLTMKGILDELRSMMGMKRINRRAS